MFTGKGSLKSSMAVAALFASQQQFAVMAYKTTLEDCQAFAALFSTTCNSQDTAVASVANLSSTEFTCTGSDDQQCAVDRCTKQDQSQCPAKQNTASSCTFQHKQCVTCALVGGDLRIRVQNNGMPNHCFFSTTTNEPNY